MAFISLQNYARCRTTAFVALPSLPSKSRKRLRPPAATTQLQTTRCTACLHTPGAQHSTHIPPFPTAPLSRRAFLALISAAASATALPLRQVRAAAAEQTSAYNIAPLKDGAPLSLRDHLGKVTLFVNVATYCALTPQYSGLVELHDKYQSRGFEIVASPCDQFGHQEPGSNSEICNFAKKQFGARFLLLDKLNVNDGPGGVAPLYQYLRQNSPEGTGARVTWNFEKFLVGTDGEVLRRYKPGVLPEQISSDIEWALVHPKQSLPPKPKPYLGVQ